jgi:maltose alpha-D-glucosyltransferase / alpha-amylase
MLRSFHYAAFAPLLGAASEKVADTSDVADKTVWAERWYSWVADRFLREYFKASREASYFPPCQSETKSLLQLYLLEKGVYELGYELNNRPTWVGIPLRGISRLLAT